MKNYTTIMGNLLSHLSRSEFDSSVKTYSGDYRIRNLGCYDLLKTLVYGQVTSAFSVREIESSLNVNSKKLYHSGMRSVKKSTLCDAMENRDHRIFQKGFELLVEKARIISGNAGRRFKNPLKIIDASTIDLCLTRFNWAKFRSTKGAVKLHVKMDGDHGFPQQVILSNGNVHEVNELDNMVFKQGDIIVMDRGYIDFKRLFDIDISNATFVTRMKENCQYTLVSTKIFPKNEPVRDDAVVRLTSLKGQNDYSKNLRRITYYDPIYHRKYVFMTNNFSLTAQEIADVYKARWQVELFFKWIKQNLKIKTFWGTSSNAVYIQIWVALILFMLLWIARMVNAIDASMQRILQILKTTILGMGSLADLFLRPDKPGSLPMAQLTFIGFKS